MAFLKQSPLLMGVILLVVFARPTLAFGAGNIANISKVEGENWRHGDIEDALLKIVMARAAGGKAFGKLDVSRVYFGNWLRDYSQAIDVGTVKSVSSEAVRLLLCILGFLTFGYGSREFEVTADRLGCYRPEDHIDNPKDYADNEDARNYDRRLRAPVDEAVELAVDENTGMKNYIANEHAGIMTSAYHVRQLFGKCIDLGRSYGRSGNKDELYEALRLLGTGLHCLEDYFAHSNYTELALIELGERDVFPHVGRNTKLRIAGARSSVYPIVTGTFGGVDFLHSVTGEVSDKLTQNEIQELEGTLEQSKNSDTSMLRDLLDKIPDGLLGGDKKTKLDQIQTDTATSQVENMSVSPREPEEFTRYIQQVFAQIMPVIQFHDEVLQSISEKIESIPILPKILEQLEEQLSMFVFSNIAPFILPVIQQIKNELMTGSTVIIANSKNEQHVVFHDDDCSDPTHSMLSKDHFSNILNEVAGKNASAIVSWVVPQIMEAWDDDSADMGRILNRIIYGVLHHPAQRDMGDDGARDGRRIMFRTVEQWWNGMDEGAKDEHRRKLSRDGVQNGENHKEGQNDCGHGCGKPLKMHKNFEPGGTMEDRIAGAAAGAILGGVSSGFSNIVQGGTGVKIPEYKPQTSFSSAFSGGGGGESSGGNPLGGLVGGLLGSAFKQENTESHSSRRREDDGGYTQSYSEYGQSDSGDRRAQAEYRQTEYEDGGRRAEYNRSEQRDEGYGGGESRYEQRTETSWGGQQESYQESSATAWGGGGGQQREEHRQEERRDDEGGEGGFGGILGDIARQAQDSFGNSDNNNNEERRGGGWGF